MSGDFWGGVGGGVVVDVVVGLVAFILFLLAVVTASQESASVVARREAECKRQLAVATASDSLRVYRVQPKCFEVQP